MSSSIPCANAVVDGQDEEEEEPDLDFGEPLGACMGVVAYSNLDDYYFSGERSYHLGVYVGYRFQCVEWARRHMLVTQGCIFGQCGPAHEIFDMTTATDVVDGSTVPFIACPNGETQVKPRKGMTLVYPIDKKMPVGHVAVIAEVGDDWVGIAEENQASKPWHGKPYGRTVPLHFDAEKKTWRMKETMIDIVDCRGWLYIPDVQYRVPLEGTTEEDLSDIRKSEQGLYPELKVQEQFIEETGDKPKKLYRFSTPLLKPAAKTDEKERMGELQEQYLRHVEGEIVRLLQVGKITKDHLLESHHLLAHAAAGGETAQSLFAAARVPFWHSIYAPNEALGVSSIGEAVSMHHLLEYCIVDTIGVLAGEDKKSCSSVNALAKSFEMPPDVLRACAEQVSEQSHVSVQLSTLDFGLGTMGSVYDPTVNNYRITHAQVDSLAHLIDIHAFQDTYTTAADFFKQGWRITTCGNDFHRTVRNFQKFRKHIHNADSPLDFLDFGTVDELKTQRGVEFRSDADAYHYGLEHLQAEYLAEYLVSFLKEKQVDVENGDLVEKDRPQWTVNRVNFFDDSAVQVNKEKGTLEILLHDDSSDGTSQQRRRTVHFAWKMCPWPHLFLMSEKNDKVRDFITYVACNVHKPVVFQPLWCHVASHRHFMPLMSKWAADHDDDPRLAKVVSRVVGRKPSDFVIPVASWSAKDDAALDDSGTPRNKCSFKIPRFRGVSNPKLKTGDVYAPSSSASAAAGATKLTVSADVDIHVTECENFYPTLHAIVVGGKRSASMMLEARRSNGCCDDEDNGGCSILEAVHPAVFVYMPWILPDDDEYPAAKV